jgi:hypothetical protein
MKPLSATLVIVFAICVAPGTRCLVHGQPGATVRESRIDVGGAQLYAREVGKGPVIIVLHGGPDFDQSYLLPEMDVHAREAARSRVARRSVVISSASISRIPSPNRWGVSRLSGRVTTSPPEPAEPRGRP